MSYVRTHAHDFLDSLDTYPLLSPPPVQPPLLYSNSGSQPFITCMTQSCQIWLQETNELTLHELEKEYNSRKVSAPTPVNKMYLNDHPSLKASIPAYMPEDRSLQVYVPEVRKATQQQPPPPILKRPTTFWIGQGPPNTSQASFHIPPGEISAQDRTPVRPMFLTTSDVQV